MKWFLRGGVVVMILGAVVWWLFVGRWLSIREKMNRIIELHRMELIAYESDFRKTYDQATQFSWATPFGEGRDAGPWLNQTLARLPTSNPAWISAESKWIGSTADSSTSTPSLRWMSELLPFGHWNVLEASVVEHLDVDLAHPGGVELLVEWPHPDVYFLRNAAEHRLDEGKQRGELRAALAETRQLARLLLASQSVLLELGATTMLAAEAKWADTLTESERAVLRNWDFAKSNEAHQTQTAIWDLRAFMSPLAPPDLRRRIVQDGSGLGLCAALAEWIVLAAWMRPLLEASYAEYYAWLEQEIGKENCRFNHLRPLWKRAKAFDPVTRWPSYRQCLTETPQALTWVEQPLVELSLQISPWARQTIGEVVIGFTANHLLTAYKNAIDGHPATRKKNSASGASHLRRHNL